MVGQGKLIISTELMDLLERVLSLGDASLKELSVVAGLNISEDFKGADLRGLDLRAEDLTGFDLSGALVDKGMISGGYIGEVNFFDNGDPDLDWERIEGEFLSDIYNRFDALIKEGAIQVIWYAMAECEAENWPAVEQIISLLDRYYVEKSLKNSGEFAIKRAYCLGIMSHACMMQNKKAEAIFHITKSINLIKSNYLFAQSWYGDFLYKSTENQLIKLKRNQ